MDTITSVAGLDDTSTRLRLIDGDHRTLAEVYQRHSGIVLGLAQKITRNRTLAEDVAQEVFVRLWRQPERFDPSRGTLRSYLLAQTHGRSVDVIRSESSRRIREDRDATLNGATTVSIEDEVVELRMSEHIRLALGDLPAGERDAIEMAYFGGHSYRRVAELLGEAEGTVKSRIRTGMLRLGATLRASGITP
ncbi:MAG TPA: sigma-70 family RNA polymerase sigma factor [Acidimicrobiia bacterium]|nr:sigma-70 family RNA polymerase sigma factor [Acidimicrobiia bacterium]